MGVVICDRTGKWIARLGREEMDLIDSGACTLDDIIALQNPKKKKKRKGKSLKNG